MLLRNQQKDQYHHQQQNMVRKSKYKNYLQITAKDPYKNELLNEFLALKIYQHGIKIYNYLYFLINKVNILNILGEKINLMLIPE